MLTHNCLTFRQRHPTGEQRRARRLFTVGEVEALVTAVERLGTGRWRDVKQRAFPLAKHRTYADLKVGRFLVTPPITSLVAPSFLSKPRTHSFSHNVFDKFSTSVP